MYLSDRDLRWAIECGKLIVRPEPKQIDSSSIDLHLDSCSEAKIWDIGKFATKNRNAGRAPHELNIGRFDYKQFAPDYLCNPPAWQANNSADKVVVRSGNEVIVRPGGFLLWQTKEVVGTPGDGADLICFVDGKSTRARTGLLVHLTAPTIHASWFGNIVLEIANLGPFDFVLREDEVIAQITVSKVTSIPEKNVKSGGSSTINQRHVTANE